ncbi:MAG: DUF4012 domain-containing protein [Patescibacteria group bacterium]
MKIKESKNYWQKNQGSNSPFVVDLRQAALKFEKEIKKEEKIIKKKIKYLKPDLLKKQPIKRNISLAFLNDIFNANKFLFLKKYLNLKIAKKKKSSLSDFISAKEEIFIKALEKKIRKNKKKEILAEAEEKVIWYRSILTFFAVLCLLIIPFKIFTYFDFFNFKKLEANVLIHSQIAMSNLLAATNSASKMNFKEADSNFQSAGQNFLAAQTELNVINDSILALASLSNDPKIKLAAESKNFLHAGIIASSLGRNLVLATDSLFSGDKNSFSVALDNFAVYGQAAVKDANDLKNILAKIDINNLPADYQTKFSSLNKQAALLSNNLSNFVDAGLSLKEALGLSRDKRYLLVFQNNSELRASGGFIGSYALVDFRDGKIRNLEVPGGGSYDTEAGLNMHIIAPKPLWLVNPLWHFWDANWWADWPTTAKNLMWFYEKSNGPSVDGVISVTPTVIERLLEISGPIDLTKEYGLVIDSNNFWETTQKVVERNNLIKTHPDYVVGLATSSTVVDVNLPLQQDLENNPDNKPKKIIGDLMAKILEVLPQKLNKDNLVNIISLLEENLAEKQIMFYFTDSNFQAAVSKRNWAGEIKTSDKDYLMVVDTNIAGQKTDRKIIENIEHASEVGSDGTIINTLKITRTHTGIKNEPLTGVRNNDWLRIYVPLGSELISATGFSAPDDKYLNKKPESEWFKSPLLDNEENALTDAESNTKIYTENDKTVFANWTMVDPGQRTEIIIKYRLPFNFFAFKPSSKLSTYINKFLNPDKVDLLPYSLLLQKQPGTIPADFSSRLVLPDKIKVFWRYPDNLLGDSGWEINTKLDRDKYWSILFSNK